MLFALQQNSEPIVRWIRVIAIACRKLPNQKQQTTNEMPMSDLSTANSMIFKSKEKKNQKSHADLTGGNFRIPFV